MDWDARRYLTVFAIGFIAAIGYAVVIGGVPPLSYDVVVTLGVWGTACGLLAMGTRYTVVGKTRPLLAVRVSAVILTLPTVLLLLSFVREGARVVEFNSMADSTAGVVSFPGRGTHGAVTYSAAGAERVATVEFPEYVRPVWSGKRVRVYFRRDLPDSAHLGPARPHVGSFGGWMATIWLIGGPILVVLAGGMITASRPTTEDPRP